MILPLEFAPGKNRAEFVEHNIGAGFLDFADGWGFGAVDLRAGKPLDLLNLKQFTAGGERDRPPAAAGTSGAADAMQVIFRVVRQVVVEDHLNVLDIDP